VEFLVLFCVNTLLVCTVKKTTALINSSTMQRPNSSLKDVLLGSALFAALSPGLLLTLPPESKGIWMSGQSSPRAIAVHTAVFAATFMLSKSLLETGSLTEQPKKAAGL